MLDSGLARLCQARRVTGSFQLNTPGCSILKMRGVCIRGLCGVFRLRVDWNGVLRVRSGDDEQRLGRMSES